MDPLTAAIYDILGGNADLAYKISNKLQDRFALIEANYCIDAIEIMQDRNLDALRKYLLESAGIELGKLLVQTPNAYSKQTKKYELREYTKITVCVLKPLKEGEEQNAGPSDT